MRAPSVLVVLPLLVACMRTVDLGERGDAGADVLRTDVPAMDVLRTDVPVIDVLRTDVLGADVLRSDVPAKTSDAALPFCPEEVDHNTPMEPDLRFRRAAFALPPDRSSATPLGGSTVAFDGTWVGTRPLEVNIVLGCPAGDIRYACRADTVIQVMDGGALFELVVGFGVDELAALTPGTPVSVRARASRWDGAAPLGYEAELLVRRRADSALMLAAVTGSGDFSGFEIPVGRDVAACSSRPEALCNRTLHAFALRFGLPGASVAVEPDITDTLRWRGATYTVRNRVAWARVPRAGNECADLTPPVTSFEIVRQPGA
jgi:hypothetical protein